MSSRSIKNRMVRRIEGKGSVVEINLSRWSLTTRFHYRSKVKRQLVRSHNISNPYHAVSIACGTSACNEARQVQGVRFLSAEAPRLPLRGCDAARCACRYQHHADRREADRRNDDPWVTKQIWNGAERRKTAGRRITDS